MKKCAKILGIAEDILLSVCVIVTFLALLLQVISRFIFHMPLTWTEELARFLLIWTTYFGLNYAIRNDCNIRLDMLVKHLPSKIQKFLNIIINVVILYCIGVYLPSAVKYFETQSKLRSSLMRIPMHYVTLPLVVGIAVSGLDIFLRTLQELSTLLKKEEKA